jgi:hypothetical protein
VGCLWIAVLTPRYRASRFGQVQFVMLAVEVVVLVLFAAIAL